MVHIYTIFIYNNMVPVRVKISGYLYCAGIHEINHEGDIAVFILYDNSVGICGISL